MAILPFGTSIDESDDGRPVSDNVQRLLAACHENPSYRVIERRSLLRETVGEIELIVVACHCGQVPSRNPVGIRPREILAIGVPRDCHKPPEVWALRDDFPLTMHQNQARAGEAKSLCLYLRWAEERRSWTPELHLNRILWWLEAISTGTIHGQDQPVEQLFFDGAYLLVLPNAFDRDLSDPTRRLVVDGVRKSNGQISALLAKWVPREGQPGDADRQFVPAVIEMPPVLHGVIQEPPYIARELIDWCQQRGVDLIAHLGTVIRGLAQPSGINRQDASRFLLIIRTPITREEGTAPEKVETRAFVLDYPIVTLGTDLAVLQLMNDQYLSVQLIGPGPQIPDALANAPVIFVGVRDASTRAYSRIASGIVEEDATFRGVLIGVGALGSAIADIWSHEAWGTWTFIDQDVVEPHNLVRHTGQWGAVGHFKSDVVAMEASAIYPEGEYPVTAVAATVENPIDPRVLTELEGANIVVDMTTSLAVPRELSGHSGVGRSVSAFITPLGTSSVLILENNDRSIRLDALEAQYYRALINENWGGNHLQGHLGRLWVGGGCRDITSVLPLADIRLHAAILARQIRQRKGWPEPAIIVWELDRESGLVTPHQVHCRPSVERTVDGFRIVVSEGLVERLIELRRQHLPAETGGVILGYVDVILQAIYIVDVTGPTADSVGDETGFVRGTEGLRAKLDQASDATAGIVRYLGEWHSHPPGASARPSEDDRVLLAFLAEKLREEGRPALMIIVGETDLFMNLRDG